MKLQKHSQPYETPTDFVGTTLLRTAGFCAEVLMTFSKKELPR